MIFFHEKSHFLVNIDVIFGDIFGWDWGTCVTLQKNHCFVWFWFWFCIGQITMEDHVLEGGS